MTLRDILEALVGLVLVVLGMNAVGDPEAAWYIVLMGLAMFGFGFWMITDSVRPRC